MKKKSLKSIGLGIIGGLIPLGVFLIIYINNPDTSPQRNVESQLNIPVSNVNYMPSSVNGGLDFTTISQKAVKSVVHVKTKIVRSVVRRDPFLEFFYGPGAGRKYKQYGRGSGSGVIVSNDGYIVTNNHVIENASKITVTLYDNTTYDARVVGTDLATDIAVLKIDAKNLRPMPIGNSNTLEVGQWVLAVGNPFNLTSTVTAGIVSAKARNIHIIAKENRDNENIIPIESFIQTDAAVNPGNSGGALINTHGQLVGINTAIASQTGNYAGYSFAVPSNLMAKVMHDLIDYGVVQRGFLGVSIRKVTQDLIDEKGLDNSDGVYIVDVKDNSGAKKAGIKGGDVILKVGTTPINSIPKLQGRIGSRSPGDTVRLTIRREGKELVKNVILRNENGKIKFTSRKEIKAHSVMGAIFADLTKKEKKELGIENGVKITSISAGKLRAVGLKAGIVITKINGEPVESVKELTDYLRNKEDRGVLLQIVYPDGKKDYVGFGL